MQKRAVDPAYKLLDFLVVVRKRMEQTLAQEREPLSFAEQALVQERKKKQVQEQVARTAEASSFAKELTAHMDQKSVESVG